MPAYLECKTASPVYLADSTVSSKHFQPQQNIISHTACFLEKITKEKSASDKVLTILTLTIQSSLTIHEQIQFFLAPFHINEEKWISIYQLIESIYSNQKETLNVLNSILKQLNEGEALPQIPSCAQNTDPNIDLTNYLNSLSASQSKDINWILTTYLTNKMEQYCLATEENVEIYTFTSKASELYKINSILHTLNTLNTSSYSRLPFFHESLNAPLSYFTFNQDNSLQELTENTFFEQAKISNWPTSLPEAYPIITSSSKKILEECTDCTSSLLEIKNNQNKIIKCFQQLTICKNSELIHIPFIKLTYKDQCFSLKKSGNKAEVGVAHINKEKINQIQKEILSSSNVKYSLVLLKIFQLLNNEQLEPININQVSIKTSINLLVDYLNSKSFQEKAATSQDSWILLTGIEVMARLITTTFNQEENTDYGHSLHAINTTISTFNRCSTLQMIEPEQLIEKRVQTIVSYLKKTKIRETVCYYLEQAKNKHKIHFIEIASLTPKNTNVISKLSSAIKKCTTTTDNECRLTKEKAAESLSKINSLIKRGETCPCLHLSDEIESWEHALHAELVLDTIEDKFLHATEWKISLVHVNTLDKKKLPYFENALKQATSFESLKRGAEVILSFIGEHQQPQQFRAILEVNAASRALEQLKLSDNNPNSNFSTISSNIIEDINTSNLSHACSIMQKTPYKLNCISNPSGENSDKLMCSFTLLNSYTLVIDTPPSTTLEQIEAFSLLGANCTKTTQNPKIIHALYIKLMIENNNSYTLRQPAEWQIARTHIPRGHLQEFLIFEYNINQSKNIEEIGSDIISFLSKIKSAEEDCYRPIFELIIKVNFASKIIHYLKNASHTTSLYVFLVKTLHEINVSNIPAIFELLNYYDIAMMKKKNEESASKIATSTSTTQETTEVINLEKQSTKKRKKITTKNLIVKKQHIDQQPKAI